MPQPLLFRILMREINLILSILTMSLPSFRPTHVPFTVQSRDSALIYINALYARNNTSISGAFATAVPQFTSSNDSTANYYHFSYRWSTYGLI